MTHNREIRRNFLVMCFIWMATSMAYYIFSFNVKSIRDQTDEVFNYTFSINNTVSLANTFSIFLTYALYKRIGLRKALLVTFTLSAFGCILLFLLQIINLDEKFLYPSVALIRFGQGASFALIYLSNFIFPVNMAS